MMRLNDIVSQYTPALLEQYGHELLPGQRKALSAFQLCRSATAPKMLLSCDNCDESSWLPHSCGNRHCPHCQAHESQHWIDKQLQKLVPGEYFMLTFTLPAQFRALAWLMSFLRNPPCYSTACVPKFGDAATAFVPRKCMSGSG